MAYYGIELSYKIDLKLHARKETPLSISGANHIGEKSDRRPKEIKIKGKRTAGRKLKVEPGEHTRDREGVAV